MLSDAGEIPIYVTGFFLAALGVVSKMLYLDAQFWTIKNQFYGHMMRISER